MNEKFVVFCDEGVSEEFSTEAEALSCAKDLLFELREEVSDNGEGWGPMWVEAAKSIRVTRVQVVYEARQCDVQEPTEKQKAEGYEFACDYQMFPVEETVDA